MCVYRPICLGPSASFSESKLSKKQRLATSYICRDAKAPLPRLVKLALEKF